MKRTWKRALSFLCTFAMLAGMLPVTSLAAAGAEQSVSGGINGYEATMQADSSTRDSWKDAFNANSIAGAVSIDGTQRSSQLNGKIWVDKSVSVGDDNSFDVTFSALGQTFASQESSQENIAYDVVFVVDVSGSMNYRMDQDDDRTPYRMQSTVNALNTTVDALMANKNNRIAVVVFNTTGKGMLPLGHYSKNSYQNDFFSYLHRGNTTGYLSFSASGNVNKYQIVNGGTNQQAGFFGAADILNSATIPAGSPKRIPVVIMLTDGTPDGGDFTAHYKENLVNDGSVNPTTLAQDDDDHYYTICTAAYKKDRITTHYQAMQSQQSGVAAKFYTIGMGLTTGGNDEIMLNPAVRDPLAHNTDYQWSLSGTINDNPAQTMGFTSYNYADKAWVDEAMTYEDLKDIFNSIISDLGDLGVNTEIGEATGQRDRITYYETLGEGVRFTGKMTLTVPKYEIVDNEIQGRDSVIYNLTAYKEDGLELTPAEGPSYLANGHVVTFRANGNPAELKDLSITVRQLSDGMRQMQVDIPPELMAYNVYITKSENGQTVYDYYEATEPLKLTYGVMMREDKAAGDYLVSAPARSYVHFIPSSAQTEEGTYDMPYYWNWDGGNFVDGAPQVNKTGTGVTGASDYVTNAQKGNNNDVYIYLGNNGLYQLSGKNLTFHLFWDDAENQDGMRPEAVTVKLYQEKVPDNSTSAPTSAPSGATTYGDPITLTASNTIDGDQSYWEYTTEDLPVYQDGSYLRYWLQITSTHDGYADTLNNSGVHNHSIRIEGQGSVWYCFGVEGGLLTDAKLDVKMTHTPETIQYAITKQWDVSTGDASTTENSVQVQLYANGVEVNEHGTTAENTNPFTITHTGGWQKTLTLPRYSQGVEVSYTLVEQGDKYTAIIDSQRDDEYGNYTVTVKNYSNVDKTNFTVIKTWDDANNQDGQRPNSVTFTLTAKTESDASLEAGDIGLSSMEATVTSNNNWRYTWSNLPKTVAGKAVTYGVTETAVSGYTPSYNYNVPEYAFVTNAHTPATVDITIHKAWEDNNNQDGIRPDSISGSLYRKDGSSYTKVQDFVITGDSTTIEDLPKNANGTPIEYYVTENAVPDYTTSGTSGVKVENVTYYPVISNEVTLTNTHTPITVTYTVNLTWDDNNNAAGQRPGTVTVNLGNEYSVTLSVGAGNTGITGVQPSTLPDGASATWNNGTLTITGLPEFVDKKQQNYQGSVAEIQNYAATITGFGLNTVSYKLSYTGTTTYDSLDFTKVWVNYTYKGYDMRPSTSQYAQYLILQSKVGDGAWTTVEGKTPVITASENNYTVTYTGLDMYRDGQKIQYQVQEKAVPNFTTTNNTVALTAGNKNQLTNTFTLDGNNTYGAITVTKEWDDADAPANSRPTYTPGSTDPLGIQLYRTTDDNHTNGIAPSSISVDGNTWTYTWNASTVLKTNKDGSSINYVAYESKDLTNYTATNRSVNVTEGGNEVQGAKIVNTYSGTAATGALTISKEWADDAQYTTARPAELTFIITGTFDGSNASSQITRTATMTAAADWKEVTVDNLPLTVDGKQVTYTVEEANVPAVYTATYSGNGVTLSSETKNITVTNTYAPDTWTLTYHANGGTNAPTDSTEYSKTNATATVLGKGQMTYTGYTFLGWSTDIHGVVTEQNSEPDDMLQADDSYTMTGDATLYAVWAVDANGDGTPDYNEKQITVNVVWNDDGNRCGIRPNSIDFTLQGKPYTVDLANSQGVLITTNNGNTQWIYTVPALFPQNTEFTTGDLTGITVNAQSHADPNDTNVYTSSVSLYGNVYTITLTHTPETTSHKVIKNWNFGTAGFTVGTATIHLLGNGKDVPGADDITFFPNGAAELTWEDLPKYEGGKLITYHAVETQVLDDSAIDVTGHFQVTYNWDDAAGTTTITNTYSDLRNISLLYLWDDDDNATGERPDSVTVQLYTVEAGGQPQAFGQPIEISKTGNWTATWQDLPVSDGNTTLSYEAHVVAYKVDGQSVNVNLDDDDQSLGTTGYTFDVMSIGQDSVFVMNSALDNNTATFTVKKTWTDKDNAYTTRPTEIWVNLLQNGSVYDSVKLDAVSNWTYIWNDLPELDSTGTPYQYTVQEMPVPGYTAKVEGGFITNSLDALDPNDPTKLTVTYVYNNGQANTSETVNYGGTATAPAPTWDGHAFKGWYTDNGTFQNAYNFKTPVTQNITLYAKWVSVHDGQEDTDDHHFITFVYDHASATDANGTAIDTSVNKIQVACGSSFQFTAAADSGYILNVPTFNGSAVLQANGSKFTLDNITSDITVTITAERQTTGGGGGGGSSQSKPELNKEDHIAYVSGYPDGTVKPNNLITREEVATIFFRLLTDESRAEFITEYAPYSDVASDRWSFYAIATLTNANIMTGRDDGTFDPGTYITRGEFAVVAAQFSNAQYSGPDKFSDIANHWARSYINRAAYEGWTTGYPDGTYGPDQYITRAEVMALVNEVLERSPNADYMLDDMTVWPDNPETAWYYADVQEATNCHSYEERTESDLDEHWIEITTMRTYDEMVRDAFNAAK